MNDETFQEERMKSQKARTTEACSFTDLKSIDRVMRLEALRAAIAIETSDNAQCGTVVSLTQCFMISCDMANP